MTRRYDKGFIFLIIILFQLSCGREELATIDIISDTPISPLEKLPCQIIFAEKGEVTYLSGRIKRRGGVSRRFDKKSYALELDQKYNPAGLPRDDDWIINAAYIDKTFMRHKISYDLFRAMNPEKNVAAECAYVNVNLNGSHQGLYILMEEINGGMVGLNKSDTLAMMFKDPLFFYRDKTRYYQDSLNYFQQKYPKIYNADKTWYIESFKHFLFNSSDEAFRDEVFSWLDMENLIDWHILLLFTNNGDGLMKNYYFYKLDSETPFRFAIWDYDHTFGRDGDNEINMLERVIDMKRAVLFERLISMPETGYMERVKERWFELREQGLISHENFSRMVSENDRKIASALDKNFELWPPDGAYYYDASTYQEEIELMLAYVSLRIDQLDRYFLGI